MPTIHTIIPQNPTGLRIISAPGCDVRRISEYKTSPSTSVGFKQAPAYGKVENVFSTPVMRRLLHILHVLSSSSSSSSSLLVLLLAVIFANFTSQWAAPGLNCELQIATGNSGSQWAELHGELASGVGRAGSQWGAAERSGQCRNVTGNSRAEWASPGLNRQENMPKDLSEGVSERMAEDMSERMSEGMPKKMSKNMSKNAMNICQTILCQRKMS